MAKIGKAIWAMFCTAVGATGDGNTSWRALETLDEISKKLDEGNRKQQEFLDTLDKMSRKNVNN